MVGHHARILRGVETYAGKPIFHGLGNFVTVTQALTPEGNDSPARRDWAIRRKQLFGFEPDPDYLPHYPFHPDSKNAMIADCRVAADGGVSPGFLPCWIRRTGQPEVLGRTPADRASSTTSPPSAAKPASRRSSPGKASASCSAERLTGFA